MSELTKFKSQLRSKIVLILWGSIVVWGAFFLTRMGATVSEHAPQAMVQGFLAGFSAVSACIVLRNVMAMRNPEKLEKLYIAENDERERYIHQKAGSSGLNFILYCLAAGTAVAGNLNKTVCFSLMGAGLFVALVKGCFIRYYRNRL